VGIMAKLFYNIKPIIGLEISNTDLKVMAIDPKRWLVSGYGSLDLDPAKVKEAFETSSTYLTDSIKQLFKEKVVGTISSNRVVIGVPTARTFSRTFSLPTSVEKTLKDAVILEADQYIPLPSSTLYIDHQIINRDKKQLTVLMSAIARTVVDNVVSSVKAADLLPVAVEPGISAVGRVLTTTEDGNLPTVIVDIGPASTDIAILDGGAIRVTGSIPIGGNTFTLDIAKKLGVALENAHQLKVFNGLNPGPRQLKLTAAITPSLDKIVGETQKVMRYYDERIANGRKLEQLLVVGSGSNMPGIGEYFTNAIIIAARVASPWQKLDFGKLQEPPRQLRSRYITVAGLASVQPGSVLK